MTDADQRHRVVCLGPGRVGKTSLLKRFINGSYSDTYTETIDDLYTQEYDIQGTNYKVDFQDTAGNDQFPAMRRLSISTAHAFILVYSITDSSTFDEITQLWEHIKEERSNYQDLPCVIVGTRLDMENDRQVEKFDALNWVYNVAFTGGFVEVSAKTDEGIKEVFKSLLEQATGAPGSKNIDTIMRRRLSAHSLEQAEQADGAEEQQVESFSKKFSRSRSLIRRGSKPKVKRSARGVRNDCSVS
jgi:small GTP-binding protein